MQEIIYKIDNWTIVKLLGGLALIVTALFTLFGKLFSERLKQIWKTKSDKEIEGLKGEIQKGNSTINSLTLAYLNNFHKIQDKRIEATEKLWNAILELKSGIPSPVGLALNILLDTELSKVMLDKRNQNGESLGELIDELSEITSTSYLSSIEQNVIKYRPFLGDKALLIFYAYQGFIGRTVYNFIKGYKENTLQSWKQDGPTKGLLKSVRTDKELENLYSYKVNSFNLVLQLLETKLLHEIRENLYGKSLTVDTIEYVKSIENILSGSKQKNTSP